ncbi:MAG: glycosyltransferase family 4 protein, partial [Chloroflexota bacterium]
RGHRVTLASFVRESERQYLAALQPYCAAIHAVPLRRSRLADARDYVESLRAPMPFLIRRDALPEMNQLIDRLTRAQPFDIVHADQLTMGQFASQFQISNFKFQIEARKRPAVILDAHNAVWTIVERARQNALLPLRPLLAGEARKLKRYEGALCRQMDAVLAVSETDRQNLLTAGARADNLHVIPIAVDCEQLQPVTLQPDSNNIVSMGTLYYPPNADGVRWFLRDVFPLIRKSCSDSTLTIIGPRPPNDIVQFAIRNSQIATLTGYVPDLLPYLERAALMVVPVRAASGMRVRILEALARGIPIVTTTTGVEGIDAIHDEHLLIADEPSAFAACVARLLNDFALRERLARNGRRFVTAKYDWQVVLPAVESVYHSLLNRQTV